MSRFTNDVDIISQSLQQSVIQMMSSLITIIGVTIMMLLISPILTLLTIGMLPSARDQRPDCFPVAEVLCEAAEHSR